MKAPILLTLLLSFLLSACSFNNDLIVYSLEKDNGVFNFRSTDTDTVINESVEFHTMEIDPGKKEELRLFFIFSERGLSAKNLKAVNVSLNGRNEKNEIVEMPCSTELKVEYFNGKDIEKKEFKNNTAPLNSLVDFTKVNYTYEFLGKKYEKNDNEVTYTFNDQFKMENYPDTLKLTVTMLWENGERKYETLLHKENYSAPKINIKY